MLLALAEIMIFTTYLIVTPIYIGVIRLDKDSYDRR